MYVDVHETRRRNSVEIPGDQYLPKELWMEVLANLPVKKLLRIRCVSKTFRNIIDNPVFINMHRSIYPSNRDKSYILSHNIRVVDIDKMVLTIHTSDTFSHCSDLMKIGQLPSYFPYSPLASVDGLILVRQRINSLIKRVELGLWNPSIRKYLRLPPSPFCNAENCHYAYALVLASSSKYDDYQVVAFEFHPASHDDLVVSVAIFAFHDGFWSNVETYTIEQVPFPRLWGRGSSENNIVSFNGCAHWLVGNPEPQNCTYTGCTHLVWFNTDVKRFTFLELPEEGAKFSFLFLHGHSIAVLRISRSSASIWLLKKYDSGDQNSWTKWYSGDSRLETYNYFDHLIVLSSNKITYVKKTDSFLMTIGLKVMSYDVVIGPLRYLTTYDITSCVDYYVESLVLSGGLEGQSLISFPSKGEAIAPPGKIRSGEVNR